MKKVFLFPLFALFLGITACHKTDTGVYTVAIEFTKPGAENEVFALNKDMDIVVKLKRDDNTTIHNVTVDITNPSNKIANLYTKHESKTGTVTENLTYKPIASGSYTITTTTTDGSGAQPNTAKRIFIVK